MLEDESGRICLVGSRISSACLVTGVILGALGIETHNGDFEVVDLCYPGMAPQPTTGLEWPSWKVSDESMDVDGECLIGFVHVCTISLLLHCQAPQPKRLTNG